MAQKSQPSVYTVLRTMFCTLYRGRERSEKIYVNQLLTSARYTFSVVGIAGINPQPSSANAARMAISFFSLFVFLLAVQQISTLLIFCLERIVGRGMEPVPTYTNKRSINQGSFLFLQFSKNVICKKDFQDGIQPEKTIFSALGPDKVSNILDRGCSILSYSSLFLTFLPFMFRTFFIKNLCSMENIYKKCLI